MKGQCRLCKQEFSGRSDKIFCSISCKTEYHRKLRATNPRHTKAIDKILHRNRTILLEVMGKYTTQKKVSSMVLDRKRFNYNYITKFTINKEGKTYHHVYDFAWMRFSDDQILIVRKSSRYPN